MAKEDPVTQLKDFVAQDPDSKYSFNSDRDAPQAEICREGKNLSRKCITIKLHSTKMFAAMQDLGFFCALPMDPARTEIECTRIPRA